MATMKRRHNLHSSEKQDSVYLMGDDFDGGAKTARAFAYQQPQPIYSSNEVSAIYKITKISRVD
jgi:hypothetical protein